MPGVGLISAVPPGMLRSPRLRRLLTSVGAIALLLALAGGALVLRAARRGGGGEQQVASGQPLLAFAEYGSGADHIYTSPASDPAQRTLVQTVPHAEGWGINPAPAPAGSLFAYTVLPPDSPAQRDAPAELWVSNLATRQQTRVASDADLLVQPVLRADGRALVYRSSRQDRQSLVVVDLDSQVRSVVYSEQTSFGVYPIAFDASGAVVFSRLSTAGTDVYRVATGGPAEELFHASDNVARDWRLSPDGATLSYLAPEQLEERVVQRVHVVSLTSDAVRNLPTPAATAATAASEQYSPVWTPGGEALTVGQEAYPAAKRAAAVIGLDGSVRALPAPAQGFDVPLAWSQDGDYLAVQTFDGMNSSDPGKASMVVVDPAQGRRIPVRGNAELIFIGWIGRA